LISFSFARMRFEMVMRLRKKRPSRVFAQMCVNPRLCRYRHNLGFRIQRKHQRGSDKRLVYTWPAKKALASIMAKVKAITRQGTSNPLSDLLRQLNSALRGWTTYFRHGVSKATFKYLSYYTWHRVIGWLRRKYRRSTWKQLRRRHLGNGGWPAQGGVTLFNPAAVPVTRYRYRGTRIPTPWDGWTTVEVG